MRTLIGMTRVAALLAGMLASAAAVALEEGRWYGGAAAGVSTTDIGTGDWNDGSLTSGEVDTDGLSYNVAAGYGFSRYIGIELNYWRIANTSFNGRSGGTAPSVWVPGPVFGATEAQGISVEGVAAWPAAQRLNLFVKGGLFFWNTITSYFPTVTSQVTVDNSQLTELNDNGVHLIYAAGAELRVYERWWLRASWTQSTVGLARSHEFTVSYPALGLYRRF